MNIKVLGSGCKKCTKLYALCNEVIEEMNVDATLEKVEDLKDILGYGVMSTPALVIDEKVQVSGKVPSKKEVKEHIENNL